MTAETSSMTTNANKKIRCRAALLPQCVLLSTAFAWRADAAEPASTEQATRELKAIATGALVSGPGAR